MSCNCHEMNRRELFEYINQISFAVDDVKLFLDTHPGNQKALEYFQKYKEKRIEALKEYTNFLKWLLVSVKYQLKIRRIHMELCA